MVYSLLSSLGQEIGPWAGGQPCLALTISSITSSSQPSPWGFSGPCLGGVGGSLATPTVGSFLDTGVALFPHKGCPLRLMQGFHVHAVLPGRGTGGRGARSWPLPAPRRAWVHPLTLHLHDFLAPPFLLPCLD